MRKSLAVALAAGVVALLCAGPDTPAGAASAYCDQTTPNTSILFYNKDSGAAVTGTLAAGQWQHKAAFNLPTGYTNAAVSRDSLVLYNRDTGAGESGTFTAGQYNRVRTYDNFNTGWTQVVASGDSALFYNGNTGTAGTGTLKDGVYKHVRSYGNVNSHDNTTLPWLDIASSCDTAIFASVTGGTPPSGSNTSYTNYGTLKDGEFAQVGDEWYRGIYVGNVTATKDSLLALQNTGSGYAFKVDTLHDGVAGDSDSVLGLPSIGSSGYWEMVGRTADSLFFYKADGTAWISKLSNGKYANVGPLNRVSSGWSIIEGGV